MAFERTEGSRPARPMRRGRKKVCSFCVDRIDTIDYRTFPVCVSTSLSVQRSFPAVLPAPALSISAH